MTTETDAYMLFTQAHAHYVRGLRRAVRERLEAAHGAKWWESGALAVLTEPQRDNIVRAMDRASDQPPEDFLDAIHFPRIVGVNHKQAFADAFPNASSTFIRMRNIAAMRNDWAHVQTLRYPSVIQSMNAMKGILASLDCKEALEIEKMSDDLEKYPQTASGELTDAGEPMDDGDDSDVEIERIDVLDYWKRIHSYLVLEKEVSLPEDGSNGQAEVLLRARNTASDIEGNLMIIFRSIRVEYYQEGGGRNYESMKDLGPGDSDRIMLRFSPGALATVELELCGDLDLATLIRVRRKSSLPDDVVAPILAEFVAEFEKIGVKKTMNDLMERIKSIDETTTIRQLSDVRTGLADVRPWARTMLRELSNLRDAYHIPRESELGNRFTNISQQIEYFYQHIRSLNEAIAGINLAQIAQVVQRLEEIRLVIVRDHDAILDIKAD